MLRYWIFCIAILAIHLMAFANAQPTADLDIPQGDPDALKSALEQRGWRVEKDSSGDFLIYPTGHTNTVVTARGEKAARREKPDVGGESIKLNELEAMARKGGWKVDRAANGDLLLYPSTFVTDETAETSQPAKKSETKETDGGISIEATDLDRLEKALGEKGWQVERGSDGDLLLFPVSEAKSDSTGRSPAIQVVPFSDCASVAREILHPENVSLPLDNETKVRVVAEAWLTVHGKGDDVIGKIRRVNSLYLVSIVAADQPHNLVTQLIIERRSGSIISVP